jgi:hypothetical protein
MTNEEKERLAERVVVLLKAPDFRVRFAELKARVDAGDEGEDGLNSAALAIAVAVAEHLRLG